MISTIAGQIRNPEIKREYMRKFLQQMKYKGTRRALLATVRDNAFYELKPVYERVGRCGKPGILFWGTADGGFKQHPLVQTAIPSIKFHAVKGAGHESIIEAPEAVNPLLIEFLRR